MCLGIPGVIVRMGEHEDLAVVDVEGVQRMINIGLLADEGLSPGDWVLVHLGFALERTEEKKARSSLDFVTGRDGAFGEV
ncbi:MAG: hydrogenase expression/formation protein HypC [Pseudonocardiales bacterium]|nr:hydrogenase expression/formation protein HypC [Pseudonocardiales bacterium]